MLTLITPTGARPDQFRLCARWMKKQDYNGAVTWIIVDDAKPVTTDIPLRKDWLVRKVYPLPSWRPGENTQGRNMAAAIKEARRIDSKLILVIEDDDYYKSDYLTQMCSRAGRFDLIGESHTVYYNVVSRRYHFNQNRDWSSLFQTAFTPQVIPIVESCLQNDFIDFAMFKRIKNKCLFRAGNLAVGIKGIAGRGGIGAGHEKMNMTADFELNVLRALIGEDCRYYKKFYDPGEFESRQKLTKILTTNINNWPV